ncbi:MAG: galactokinase [Chthonomonadales bacterium]
MEPASGEEQLVSFIKALKNDHRGFFEAGIPITVARAPGRLDVQGGVTDYSGGTVLERTISEATFVAVQLVPNEWIHICSTATAVEGDVRLPLGVLFPPGRHLTAEEAKQVLAVPPKRRWIAYVVGTLLLLMQEGLIPPSHMMGANVWVESTVPIGAGVSSSAALEVASCTAFAASYGVTLEGLKLATLCQRVENEIAGAPCGIMDQVTSALGLGAHILALKCQPHEILGHLPDPPGWRFLAIDSGVKHSVGGRSYIRARVAAFMGLKIVQTLTGNTLGGYLCNLMPEEWHELRPHVPTMLKGSEFLERYGHLPDAVTQVDPEETYFVRDCAEHAVLENQRVHRIMEILRQGSCDPDALREVGELMLAAHTAYSNLLRLGSPETDLIVALAMERGASHGIYGAKITGGGSGGAVAILGLGEDADAAARQICAEYERRTGLRTHFMAGTSEGALQLGTRQFTW